MMRLDDTLRTATHSLRANPLRSALTMLGVIIGNASFVAMASLGDSARIYTIQRLESFHGPNRLIAYTVDQDQGKSIEPVKLYISDADALRRGVPSIKAVAPVAGQTLNTEVGRQTVPVWVTGTTADYLRVKNENVAQGRFIDSTEVSQNARVVVLGSEIRKTLLGSQRTVGAMVKISNISFRVIGVMKPKGTMDKQSPDQFVYVPMTTFLTELRGATPGGSAYVDYIEIASINKQAVNDTAFQAQNLLQALRGSSGVRVAPNVPQQELLSQVSSTLTAFLAVLAGISLLIGGIGIMNVMLVTVAERTSEIGLRKALGARRKDIMTTFLIEAAYLSLSGGVVGIVVGTSFVFIASLVTPLPFVVSGWSVLLSSCLSVTVGLSAGIMPALRASELDPIVALRSD